MTREFTVVVERDEDGWFVGSVPGLPGCFSQAVTLDELVANMQEAIALYLEDRPQEASGLQFVGIHRVAVPA